MGSFPRDIPSFFYSESRPGKFPRKQRGPFKSVCGEKIDSIKRVVGIVTFVADRTPRRAALVTGDRSAFFAALKAVHADTSAMWTIHFSDSLPRSVIPHVLFRIAPGEIPRKPRDPFGFPRGVRSADRHLGDDDEYRDGGDEPDHPEQEPLVHFAAGFLYRTAAARAVLAGTAEQNKAEEPAQDLSDPAAAAGGASESGEFASALRAFFVEHLDPFLSFISETRSGKIPRKPRDPSGRLS